MFAKTLTGEAVTLEVESSDTIDMGVAKIQDRESCRSLSGTSAPPIRVSSAPTSPASSMRLEDGGAVADHDVQEGSTLHLNQTRIRSP
jgi:hypothetical protein